MAKRRKSKKSSKCPEPLNTLIDIAGGLAMGAVASHMEKKYNYSNKGKINPYAVSAIGIASGRMKSTEDILRTGAILGAMGSFDVEIDDPPSYRPYRPEDPIFREIHETKVNDNRYAWRLNCEDGRAFGLSPSDYETRSEYNEALLYAKGGCLKVNDSDEFTREPEKERPSTSSGYLYLRVSRLDNGANEFFLTDDVNIRIGDMVNVPTITGSANGVVVSVADKAPQSQENIPWIIK